MGSGSQGASAERIREPPRDAGRGRADELGWAGALRLRDLAGERAGRETDDAGARSLPRSGDVSARAGAALRLDRSTQAGGEPTPAYRPQAPRGMAVLGEKGRPSL